MEKDTPTWLRIIAFDLPTTISTLLLLAMIPAFGFADRLSELMGVFGFDREKVSHIWFLRDQYDYLKDWLRLTDLSVDLFHVSELFIWLAIAISALRLLVGIIWLGTVENARNKMQKWVRRPVSDLRYSLGWVLGSGNALLLTMSKFGIHITGTAHPTNAILNYSPKAYMVLITFVFCFGSTFFVEGIVVLWQLKFGKHEQRALVGSSD